MAYKPTIKWPRTDATFIPNEGGILLEPQSIFIAKAFSAAELSALSVAEVILSVDLPAAVIVDTFTLWSEVDMDSGTDFDVDTIVYYYTSRDRSTEDSVAINSGNANMMQAGTPLRWGESGSDPHYIFKYGGKVEVDVTVVPATPVAGTLYGLFHILHVPEDMCFESAALSAAY